MKLVDLDPRWIGLSGWASESPFYVGLSFLCPHCAAKGACPTCVHFEAKRLAVHFSPPIDPDNVQATFAVPLPPGKAHGRTGDTFETITLTPSVGFDGIGHWHGNIVNGECIP